jgi:hypothetical protein
VITDEARRDRIAATVAAISHTGQPGTRPGSGSLWTAHNELVNAHNDLVERYENLVAVCRKLHRNNQQLRQEMIALAALFGIGAEEGEPRP